MLPLPGLRRLVYLGVKLHNQDQAIWLVGDNIEPSHWPKSGVKLRCNVKRIAFSSLLTGSLKFLTDATTETEKNDAKHFFPWKWIIAFLDNQSLQDGRTIIAEVTLVSNSSHTVKNFFAMTKYLGENKAWEAEALGQRKMGESKDSKRPLLYLNPYVPVVGFRSTNNFHEW